ncbi:hypothetical protein EXIGLDRAFT_724880 [Exidia glandulosa HHB12029]|uniref:Uncharacterized protein n=1 Tax=Exidia glandulosa HHB12029 TaxID=1314781 RepID=A0A165E8S0_EXIGL|nr:hypothetical protein EXIGLDRAFT_724880 [Exidia glandulosa HHB12029]
MSVAMRSAANLPAEIVHMILETAAGAANVHAANAWVASLLLICRAARRTVEPILLETIYITHGNWKTLFDDVATWQRCASRTKHVILTESSVFIAVYRLSKLRNVVSRITTSGITVLYMNFGDEGREMLRPTSLTLTRVERFNIPWSVEVAFLRRATSITHLHVDHCCPPYIPPLCQHVPKGITHLVLDLCSFTFSDRDMLNRTTILLRPPFSVERILFRTMYLDRKKGLKDAVVLYLEKLARDEQDTRLWLDDSMPYAARTEDFHRQHARDRVAGPDVWFSGRPLYEGCVSGDDDVDDEDDHAVASGDDGAVMDSGADLGDDEDSETSEDSEDGEDSEGSDGSDDSDDGDDLEDTL